MQPVTFAPLEPKVILAVGAHPDDIDFGASGSIAKWVANGAAVEYLVLTDGSKGTSDRTIKPHSLTAQRRKEQRSAAVSLGARRVHCLDHEDGHLAVTIRLKQQIVRCIRSVRPDTVITLDPTMVYVSTMGFINHPDHRAAGQATLDAVYPLARDHLSFPELLADGLEPHNVAHVLLINLERQNYYVDITGCLDAKLTALGHHKSQFNERIHAWMMQHITTMGSQAHCQYAEGFMRIDVN